MRVYFSSKQQANSQLQDQLEDGSVSNSVVYTNNNENFLGKITP